MLRKPLPLLLALVALAPPSALADEVGVFLDDARGLTRSQELSLLAAAKAALRELSGMQVRDLPTPPADRPRAACGKAAACLQALAAGAKVQYALALTAQVQGGTLSVDGVLADPDGELFTAKAASGDASSPEAAVATFTRAVLPPFLRKGFGGIRIDAPAGATLKVDGRRIGQAPLATTQLATAGAHEVDALFPDGTATLERVKVPEGGRLRLSLSPQPLVSVSEGRSDARLYASYGLFTAGAVVIASSFIAAASARNTASAAVACSATDRSCSAFPDARAIAEGASRQTRTANLLLGVGAVLSLGGAGLFAYDRVDAAADGAPGPGGGDGEAE